MVRLQLLESAAVQGRVVAADGAAVSTALVVFFAAEKFAGRGPRDHAWTDAAGRYRLPDVPLGEVCITVIATAHAPKHARFVVAGPTTQDFQLRPGESASYRITINGASPERRARTAHDGSFALDRLDARMARKLWLRVTSSGPKHLAGPWQLSPGQHLQVGNVAIPAAATIEGTIVDEEGRPRCGIRVYLYRHGDVLDLWHVYTDRFGNYACGGLPAGDYSVKIDSPHAMHVEWPDYAHVTVRAGERVVLTRGMSLPWPLLLAVAAGALAILPVRAWRRRHRQAHASSN